MGMRILDTAALEPRVIEGVKGTMMAMDVVGEEGLGVGVRVVPPHSKVPKAGAPYARGRRVLFVLRGSATVSNGEYYEKIAAGKFVVMDDGEAPSFATGDDELVVLEVRHHDVKPSPPTLAATVAVAADVPPVARTTS
jgi:quercetin dioxygenase-like cupin family protein